MAGKLPSSGAISISDLNVNVGNSGSRTTNMNENLIRAFCGGRVSNTAVSLGNARGRGVTFSGVLSRSNYATSVSMPSVSLTDGTYFDSSQLANGFPLYTTMNVDVPPTWWASINNPRNMTSTLGTGRSVTGGGTGGSKNFYSVTTYSPQTISGSGYYSGGGTGNPNGQITLQYISLIAAGSGTGS